MTIGAIGYPVGTFIHALFVVTFWYLDLYTLAIFNIFSVIIYSVACWTHRNGWMVPTLVVAVLIEVPAHAFVATLYMGVEAGFYLFPYISVIVVTLAPFFTRNRRVLISGAIAISVIVAGVINLAIGSIAPQPILWTSIFFILNVFGSLLQTLALIGTYEWILDRAETALQREYERSEKLLDNILPAKIAAQLKDSESSIANEFSDVTILFADIVGFTDAAASLSPPDLIDLLNTVFSEFDDLVATEGVEKIKTIGDAYMVVAGLPEPRQDHATVIAGLALDMMAAAQRHNGPDGKPLQMRIGINSGPVVAGVIGHKKFAYDLWGDAVNVAARMESHGEAGRIQISDSTHALINGMFLVEERGLIDVKGKGSMTTFFLLGQRVPSETSIRASSPAAPGSAA